MDKLAPAIKAETKKVTVCTVAGVVIMCVVFFVLHRFFPEKVPFDYRVILGGICGGLIAVLNFFLMGITVQKVVNTEDQDLAKARMKASYTNRMLLQMAWVVIAIVAPCFYFVAGILPLLFPSMGIKITGIFKRPEDKQPEDKQPEDKQPEDKQPEDKQPEDKQPEDKQSETTQ